LLKQFHPLLVNHHISYRLTLLSKKPLAYMPTITIFMFFDSYYALTIIIAILRFLLYNTIENAYYLHLVSCHYSFGLVHFKQFYACEAWAYCIVTGKKTIGILRRRTFIICE